jgi:hypothetical protein
MSRRKSLGALAAVTAALGVAVPAVSASAATAPDDPFPSGNVETDAPFTFDNGHFSVNTNGLPCRILRFQDELTGLSGITQWHDASTTVFRYSGCGGATG